VEEYLTINEVASRLKVKPKTVQNKMAMGVFKKGVHYFSPKGLNPRFKWSAVVEWLEDDQIAKAQQASGYVKMAKGYILGSGPRNAHLN
jgi:hypothetical protein